MDERVFKLSVIAADGCPESYSVRVQWAGSAEATRQAALRQAPAGVEVLGLQEVLPEDESPGQP